MAKSMTERIKDWRKKKSAGGGRSLTIMLETETANLLEELKDKFQESHAKLIARALAAFNDSFTCKQEEESQAFTCKRNEEESEPGRNRPTGLSLVKEIKGKLDQGKTVISLKEEIIMVMKEMRAMGFDSSQIADQLYEAGIKTMKGNERWEGGTIRKWWK